MGGQKRILGFLCFTFKVVNSTLPKWIGWILEVEIKKVILVLDKGEQEEIYTENTFLKKKTHGEEKGQQMVRN